MSNVSRPNTQFAIPPMSGGNSTQADFNRESVPYKDQSGFGNIGAAHAVQPGQYRELPIDVVGMARHGVEAVYRTAPTKRSEAVNTAWDGRINLYEEDHTLFDNTLRTERRTTQQTALDYARVSATPSQEAKRSIEHTNPPLTPEQVAAYTRSLVAFRRNAVYEATVQDAAAIVPRHQSQWDLAA